MPTWLISALGTFIATAFAAGVSWGILSAQVREMRATLARTLERVGKAETEVASILGRLDEQREFSGRVRT